MSAHLCPMDWTGYQPEGMDVFVCGACSNPGECASLHGCARATEAFLEWSRIAIARERELALRLRAWLTDPSSSVKRERCRQASDRMAEAMHRLRELTNHMSA